jgi:hypothetical protein
MGVGWQGASEAAVVTVLQPERCDTAKRPMPLQKVRVGTQLRHAEGSPIPPLWTGWLIREDRQTKNGYRIN